MFADLRYWMRCRRSRTRPIADESAEKGEPMISLLGKAVLSAVIIVAVSEISERRPRMGALLLTLPLISILAIVMSWTRHHDLASISRLARETLILVPLGLPFFIPLAFSREFGIGFWPAFILGILAASLSIAAWLTFGPK